MLMKHLVLMSSGAATAALPGVSSDAGPGSRPVSGPADVDRAGHSGGDQGHASSHARAQCIRLCALLLSPGTCPS